MWILQSFITQAGKAKGMSKLSSWSSNIVNHFWYSCRTCNGDVKKLKVNIIINKIILQFMQEKWLGLLHHVQNEHEWIFGRYKCNALINLSHACI